MNEFYQILVAQLSASTGTDRVAWAKYIVTELVDLQTLSQLLYADKKTATRYAWLLSDVGMADAAMLRALLPYLFEQRANTNAQKFEQQLVKYWRIAGVPVAQQGTAIDMMFGWLADPKESTHIKTISLDVLQVLIKEYPELGQELKLILATQQGELSVSLRNKIKQIV